MLLLDNWKFDFAVVELDDSWSLALAGFKHSCSDDLNLQQNILSMHNYFLHQFSSTITTSMYKAQN